MREPKGILWLFPELAVLDDGEGGLDRALAEAARAGPEGALLTRSGRGWLASPAPLDREPPAGAGARDAVWILPLAPRDGLEAGIEHVRDAVRKNAARLSRAAPIPVFLPDVAGEPPVQTRLHRSWRGVLPGDRWPPRARRAWVELLQTLHPGRVPLFLALENLALGGFPLEARDGGAWTSPPDHSVRAPSGPPLIVAICGIDGSGKSTHLAALRSWLAEAGKRVAIHKIYRHGVFHDTVTDVARSCAGGASYHLWRLERLAKVFDSVKAFFSQVEADLGTHDVVLFDRYVYTHLAAIAGRSHHDPFAREMLAVFPAPHLVVLLDLPPADALARIGTRDARTIDENEYMLGRYRSVLLDLAPRLGFTVLDATAPFEENQAAIRREVARLLAGPGASDA